MQVGKTLTLTLMVRSAENIAESRAACLEEAAFWQNRESMGVCRELAKTIPEAGAGHRWWWGRVSGPVAGKLLMARRPLMNVSPPGALGALGKSPDSVGGRQRVPEVALATDSQVTLG